MCCIPHLRAPKFYRRLLTEAEVQINEIHVLGWRQFDEVSIKFHPRLTIITGPNGAGKTTILNMLSRFIGWSVSLLSVPDGDQKAIREVLSDSAVGIDDRAMPSSGWVVLSGGRRHELGIADGSGVETSYSALGQANGVYLVSHRQVPRYVPVKHIPTKVNAAEQILDQYVKTFKLSLSKIAETEIVKSEQRPSFKMKEALISLAVFGEGNSIVSPNDAALETFRGFERILGLVMPEDMGFKSLYIRMPEVLLVTDSGIFPIEALSGGASAIMDVAWQIYLASKIYDDFIVIFDEPENHLHPSLQRTLLQNLTTAFPSAQFIVSTHSPLMITSVEESSVYALSRSGSGRYRAQLLDFADRAGSAEQTLNDVLGVETSTPIWASKRLDEIVQKYEGSLNDVDQLKSLKDELERSGLSGKMTTLLARLVEADRAKNL